MAWGLTSALNVSTSAMLTKQKQMSVVSTNVANVDNPYYHRRSATVESLDLAGGNSNGGTGVYLASVSRSFDSSLENSLKSAISSDAYQQGYLTRTSELESMLGPDSVNYLTKTMAKFADGLQSLSTSPESITNRAALLSYGDALATEFNQEYSNMATLRNAIATNDANGSGYISDQLSTVNALITQLSDLNESIRRLEDNDFTNQRVLDLRDTRDKTVKQLAAYVDINVKEESNGQYTVDLNLDSGKINLINGAVIPQIPPSKLQMSMTESPVGFFSPQIAVNDGTTVTNVTLNTQNGSIRAMLDARDYIGTQMTNMYAFANRFTTEINALQNNATTYDLDGNNNAGNFFSSPVAQPASGSIISLSSDVAGSPRKIAVSAALNQSGNGDNATAMWNKLNQDGLFNDESLMSYSDRILATVAQNVSNTETSATTSASVVSMFTSAVAELSAVSMDEEMVSMLELQRAYQAAAKMIGVLDDMMQTAINMA